MHAALVATMAAVALLAGCGGDVTVEPAGTAGSVGGGGTSATTGTAAASSATGQTGGVGVTSSTGPGGEDRCNTDADCPSGRAWCDGGFCVPCDNTGLACDLACVKDWELYVRNGCHPCECAPPNACTKDKDCPGGGEIEMKCYAGKFCWDWCPFGDPSCCYGNTCSAVGCSEPNPTGCWTTGCPIGLACDTTTGCSSSGCACGGDSWGCLPDCGGGTCS